MSDTLDIQALLKEERQVERDRRRKGLSENFESAQLHWLAMLPSWTVELAKRHRANEIGDIYDLLDSGKKNRLLQVESTLMDGDFVQHFWVPSDIRREILGELRKKPPPWSFDLAQSLLDDEEQDITRQTQAWAELLLANPWGKEQREYERFVASRVESEVESLGVSAGEIWVDALKDLALMAPSWLKGVINRLQRRLIVAYRTGQDERRLRRFVPRKEQMSTVSRLLSGDHDYWCLHFLGVGGVGKTMLMRYLSARGLNEFGYHVARVDFDYLSPDYPMLDPGYLLNVIAGELRFHSKNERLDDLLDTLDSSLEILKQRMTREDQYRVGKEILELTEFQDVRRTFVDILIVLEKVLIIFDTCEELAKLDPYEANLASLEMTFLIIDDLHKAVPSLRIAFAGRRPLARSGGQDESGKPTWSIPGAVRRLPEYKAFLALRIMRGFSKNEADEFFDQTAKIITGPRHKRVGDPKPDTPLTPSVRSIILDASPEAGQPPKVEPLQTDDVHRYNPFDLNLFANWVLDDPEGAVKLIESGDAGVYIRRRIVERLESVVRPLVPIAVILRRFDQEMLATLEIKQPDIKDGFRILSEQEWIHPGREGETDTLTVDRNLLPRLDIYYHPERVIELPDNQGTETLDRLGRRIATRLAKMAAKREISRIDSHFADVVLRRQAPLAASRFWDSHCIRVAEAGDWPRLVNISNYLLGSEGAIGERAARGENGLHPLRAAVQAGLCSAIHVGESDRDMIAQWEIVLDVWEIYPQKDTGLWLKQRAELCLSGVDLVAAYREIEQHFGAAEPRPVNGELLAMEARPEFALQLMASFLAAVARELDAAEQAGEPYIAPVELLHQLRALRREIESQQPEKLDQKRAMTLSLFCRAQEFRLVQDASPRLEEDLAQLAKVSFDSRQCWFDLVLPVDGYARAALEFVRHIGSLKAQDSNYSSRLWSELTQQYGLDISVLQPNVDRERLLSAVLQLTLQHEPVSLSELQRLKDVYEKTPPLNAKCLAHRNTPPIQLTVMEGLADMGDPIGAIRFLDDFVSHWRKNIDDETRVTLSRMRLRITRRFRLNRELINSKQLLMEKDLKVDALAAMIVNTAISDSVKRDHEDELKDLEMRQGASTPQLGPRALGQYYLDAAELMQDEESAVKDSHKALSYFMSSRDVIGALRALTMKRTFGANDPYSLSGIYGQVCEVFSKKGSDTVLPSWDQLKLESQSLAQTADPDELDEVSQDENLIRNLFQNPVLGGWLSRIVAMLVSKKLTGKGITGITKFDLLLRREFTNGLPMELSRVMGKKDDIEKPKRSLIRRIVDIATTIASFGILGAFCFGLYWAIKKLYGGASQAWSTFPVLSGIIAVVIISAIIAFWLWQWYRSRIRIRITGHDESPKASSVSESTSQPAIWFSFAIKRLKISLGHSPFSSWDTNVSTRKTQLDLSPESRDLFDSWEEGKHKLTEARKRAGSLGLTVEIDVPSGFSEWSWESAVRKTLESESMSRRSRRLRLIRVGLLLATQRSLLKRLSVFILEAPDLTASVGSERLFDVDLETFLDKNGSHEKEPLFAQGAVVIYGKAFKEPSGVYLRLAKGLSDDFASNSTGSGSSYTLEPRQCARVGSPLIVLVGASVDMDKRLETDRRQTALLRRAGSEIFQAGAETVIVVPTMPKKATVTVISSLTQALKSSRKKDLLSLAQRLRTSILNGRPYAFFLGEQKQKNWAAKLGIQAESLIELANELCMYTRTDDWTKVENIREED